MMAEAGPDFHDHYRFERALERASSAAVDEMYHLGLPDGDQGDDLKSELANAMRAIFEEWK